MSATKAKRSTKKAVVATVAKKAPKARKAKAPKVEPTRSEIISAAMLELSEERKEARAERDGKPAKFCVFDLWMKAIQSGKRLDVEATAKKYPEVKPSTVSAWVNAWHNLNNLPANAKGKEKAIAAALKKVR